jgi:hypothetical protein
MSRALIGVDWGTHSSKWNWMSGEDSFDRGEFNILPSDVQLDANSDRIFLSPDPPSEDSVFESGIKGTLIRDPYGPFWIGPRRQVKLTLGELVCFSLWSLLSEAYQNLSEKGSTEPREIEVRFSLPNWVGLTGAAEARSKYEQAARVACYMFVQDRAAWLQRPSPSRSEWQAAVCGALRELQLSDDLEVDRTGFRSAIQKNFKVDDCISFRFVAESSAAGLTGLREFEGDSSRPRYLRKILVVDVGAGSTDIGYVLRTIPVVGANEVLVQLPPANTCSIAGKALTESIVKIYRARGERIGFGEAERRKTAGGGGDWLPDPSVTEWKRGIAEQVETYVADIADERWLPYEPSLHVLITGGSGVVIGLREEILTAVKNGLKQHAVDQRVIDGTALMTLDTTGPYANDVNRLAVALGAASEELPTLSYHDRLDPPTSDVPVRAARGWTG